MCHSFALTAHVPQLCTHCACATVLRQCSHVLYTVLAAPLIPCVSLFLSISAGSLIINLVIMRPLTDEETKTMFEKLSKYIGENIKLLIDRPDGTYCFRLHHDRVYYISEKMLKMATNISRDKLVSVGTCFGKFTKTQKFRLHITALDFLAPYAKYKVWVKPGAEQSYLYGNHIMKSGLGRITENTAQYQGVVVYSMADVPLVRTSIFLYIRNCFKLIKMCAYIKHYIPDLFYMCRALEWRQKTHRSAGKSTPCLLWFSTKLMLVNTLDVRTR
uniref:NIP7 nucleolar pre-rRNA processing protein n=1 Tax=Astyanax mexicanus TaxID=7994 RepID=A0A3B1IYG8_ASTMX